MTPWEKKIWLRICQKKPIDGKDIHTLVNNYAVDDKDVGYSNTLFNIEINTMFILLSPITSTFYEIRILGLIYITRIDEMFIDIFSGLEILFVSNALNTE